MPLRFISVCFLSISKLYLLQGKNIKIWLNAPVNVIIQVESVESDDDDGSKKVLFC